MVEFQAEEQGDERSKIHIGDAPARGMGTAFDFNRKERKGEREAAVSGSHYPLDSLKSSVIITKHAP